MTRILLTAFEPYDEWAENSSWLTLVEMTRWFGHRGEIVTRRYPVNLEKVTQQLGKDLQAQYDFAVHLGQAPGSSVVQLEAIGVNVDSAGRPLIAGGPVAYRTTLPLEQWRDSLRAAGIPSLASYHAGTYLCNALLYLSQHLAHQHQMPTRSLFIHLPLAPAQVAAYERPLPSMGVPMMAAAVATVLTQLLPSAPAETRRA